MYDAASTVLAQRLVAGRGHRPGDRSAAARCRRCASSSIRTALAANGIALDDVRSAIAATNANRPKGFARGRDAHWQIGANDQAKSAADYAPVILRYRNGAAVRLADVAEVERLGAGPAQRRLANGKPAVLLMLNQASRAPTSSRPSTACARCCRSCARRSRRRSTSTW